MNPGATGRIGSKVRSIIRIDVVALLLAVVVFAGASAALDRSVAVARDLLVIGQIADDGGILPSARSSAGERSAQFEERLKRLDRATPASSGGQPAHIAAAMGSRGGFGAASLPPAARVAVPSSAANVFDARAPPRSA
jgi:hypothetical protein